LYSYWRDCGLKQVLLPFPVLRFANLLLSKVRSALMEAIDQIARAHENPASAALTPGKSKNK